MTEKQRAWLEGTGDEPHDPWEDDRMPQMILDFADDDVKREAMEAFLCVEESYEDAILECFDALDESRQAEILDEYIDLSDKWKARFNEWFFEREV